MMSGVVVGYRVDRGGLYCGGDSCWQLWLLLQR